MKTSELLSKLEALNKEIPFDAEIVTGDDWMPTSLLSVHHEAPHTYLEFDWVEEENEEGEEAVDPPNPEYQAQLQVMLSAFLENLATRCSEGKTPPAEASQKLQELVNYTLAFGDHKLDAFLLQNSKS